MMKKFLIVSMLCIQTTAVFGETNKKQRAGKDTFVHPLIGMQIMLLTSLKDMRVEHLEVYLKMNSEENFNAIGHQFMGKLIAKIQDMGKDIREIMQLDETSGEKKISLNRELLDRLWLEGEGLALTEIIAIHKNVFLASLSPSELELTRQIPPVRPILYALNYITTNSKVTDVKEVMTKLEDLYPKLLALAQHYSTGKQVEFIPREEITPELVAKLDMIVAHNLNIAQKNVLATFIAEKISELKKVEHTK